MRVAVLGASGYAGLELLRILLRHAVRLMLPKNALGRAMFRKLKVYRGPTHPHAAQKPEELRIA